MFDDMCCVILFFFFFKQKTAYEMRISDWSSDVCSSDLIGDDVLTENIAILNHIAELVPEKALLPTEGLARARALEWLALRLCCKDWRQSEVGCRSAPIRRLLRNGG